MISVLTMSAKLATPGLLKLKAFLNKDYDIITPVHYVTNEIFIT